eukprot:1033041-Prorocentrum_minimum.AAC.3
MSVLSSNSVTQCDVVWQYASMSASMSVCRCVGWCVGVRAWCKAHGARRMVQGATNRALTGRDAGGGVGRGTVLHSALWRPPVPGAGVRQVGGQPRGPLLQGARRRPALPTRKAPSSDLSHPLPRLKDASGSLQKNSDTGRGGLQGTWPCAGQPGGPASELAYEVFLGCCSQP